ncbi:MAG: GlyGly-CTERM sorting domain-containing protein, partial [Stenotrophobium sp.]
ANPPNCRNLTAVWQVSYSQGVTETGSSGSALYNQNHQIIGQLSGGNSACNGSIGNGQSDVYARTDAAWTNNNAPASGQLKAWLDPDNTGVLTLGGINLYKPKVTIAVNPSTITLGGSAALTWSSTSATSCSASGAWSGSQATSGSVNVTPAAAGTATYTLACTGAGGTTRNSAVMTVNGSSGGSSSSGGGGSGSGGGAFTPLTLAALLLLVFLRRTPDLLRRYSHRRLHA